jgi:hypothetical protein
LPGSFPVHTYLQIDDEMAEALPLWSAPAERSGEGALDLLLASTIQSVSRYACHTHSIINMKPILLLASCAPK